MPALRLRRVLPSISVVLAAIGLSACQADSPFGEDQEPPTVLVASPIFSEGNEGAQAQLEILQRGLDALRADTASAWTGRQDDVTGYLTDLSGGRFTSTTGPGVNGLVESFFDTYGLDLFGVPYDVLAVADLVPPDVMGPAAVRATQEFDEVPVVDAHLTIGLSDPREGAAITGIRGRVFPGLSPSTEPTVSAKSAVRSAERVSDGERTGEPTLVIVPNGAGLLAWEIAITGATGSGLSLGDGLYYLDAITGDLIEVRPLSAEANPTMLNPVKLGARSATANAAEGDPVEVSGTGPSGEQVTAVGRQTADGVELVDATVPSYDPATGEGGIYTFSAQDTENVPGKLYVERSQNGGTISDPDALAAHAYSRTVYDYYASMGRNSWDGAGSSLISSVNYSDDKFCNAYFSDTLNPPQMVYGNACTGPGGAAQMVTVDLAGHEITHGVTATTADLVYSGQSGALNEAFSDYFGNVIGNRAKGTDDSTISEDGCTGVSQAQNFCEVPTADGGYTLRQMLNGATNADYLRLLNPTLRLRVVREYDADHGGVHLNSAIWNNAMWTIRTRLAQIDGVDGNTSPLAQDFDKIAFATLTTQLGPASDFIAARAAIERVTVDAGADPVILRVAREVFDQVQICAGCVDLGTVNGEVVSAASQTQIEPSVHGDDVTWIDLSQGNPGIGLPALASVGGEARSLASTPDTAQLVFAGDSLLAVEVPTTSNELKLVRYDETGVRTVLSPVPDSTVLTGIAGSDEGAAWVTTEKGTISFIDPAGQVTTEALPDLGGDNVTALGTGQGVVGLGTEGGQVLRWRPGAGFVQLGRTQGTVYSVAAYGERVLAVDDANTTTVFDTSGLALQVSDSAITYGAAMNGDYAVWTEGVGDLTGPVADSYGGSFDSDLYLYSFETGTIYNLLAQTGQQGYPAISGDRIVWQDTVFGGNDILTATLPPGL